MTYYCEVLGAALHWRFQSFGADVAAVSLGEGPLLLLADHQPAPSCEMIFEVEDLESTVRQLSARGWSGQGESFEIPNGPCRVFVDPHDSSRRTRKRVEGKKAIKNLDERPSVVTRRPAIDPPAIVVGVTLRYRWAVGETSARPPSVDRAWTYPLAIPTSPTRTSGGARAFNGPSDHNQRPGKGLMVRVALVRLVVVRDGADEGVGPRLQGGELDDRLRPGRIPAVLPPLHGHARGAGE